MLCLLTPAYSGGCPGPGERRFIQHRPPMAPQSPSGPMTARTAAKGPKARKAPMPSVVDTMTPTCGGRVCALYISMSVFSYMHVSLRIICVCVHVVRRTWWKRRVDENVSTSMEKMVVAEAAATGAPMANSAALTESMCRRDVRGIASTDRGVGGRGHAPGALYTGDHRPVVGELRIGAKHDDAMLFVVVERVGGCSTFREDV